MASATYGTVPQHDEADAAEDGTAVVGDDTQPLLGNGKPHPPAGFDGGSATILSSIANLDNTIIGSGMLTFPLAMASSGLLPGILTCAFCGFVAGLGLFYLSRCAARVVPNRSASFYSVARLAFPAASLFFDLAIAIKCFGVSISYLIIIKGLMPQATRALYHALKLGDVPDLLNAPRFWLILFMGVLAPLSFLRRLDNLRHTSYVALFSVAYLVVVVITCYFAPPPGMTPRGDVSLIRFTPDFVSTFPVQVFAFTCSQNLFPIFNELRTNSQPRMNLIIGTSILQATVIYEIIAIFGYLTFGSSVGANIIAMYPETSLFIAIGQLAIVVLVLFSYPLQVLPCRNCLDKVVDDTALLFRKRPAPSPAPAAPEEETEEDGEAEPQPTPSAHDPSNMPLPKHIILTCAIIAAGFTIAFFVSDLQIVLSFVGSTGSTTISFILPGLLFYQLFKSDPRTGRTPLWGSVALAIYGLAILVFCLSYNIYKVVHSA